MKKIFTGALAFLLFAGAASAQQQDSSRHHRGGHDMAKELNLTADQQSKLKAIRKDQHDQEQAIRADKSLTADQQKAKSKELHKQYSEQFQSVLTADQKAKFEQGRKEWKAKGKEDKEGRQDRQARKGDRKGGNFATELNLSQDQQDRMAKLRTESKSQFESIKSDKSLSDTQKKEKMQSLRKQQQDQMKSILTKEQLEKMQTLRKEHKGEHKAPSTK